MDFGLFLPGTERAASRGGLVHAAQTAEEFGVTTVWAADRIVIPWEIETLYKYNASGSFFVPPDAPVLEPLTVLAFLAAATERLRLGMGVLVMPYRDPVYWAKVATTLDHLSEGRFVLGVGVGWMREEFAALGKAHLFGPRGRVGDEHLKILRTLLSEDRASFRGEFHEFSDLGFQPKAPGGRIEVWVGGEAKPSQRRAGGHGDCWFPYFPRITPEEMAKGYRYVRRMAEEAGRDRDEVGLRACMPVEIPDVD